MSDDHSDGSERPPLLVWAMGFAGGQLTAGSALALYSDSVVLGVVMIIPVILSTMKIAQWHFGADTDEDGSMVQ